MRASEAIQLRDGRRPGTCARVDFLPTDKEEHTTGGANVWRSSSCMELKSKPPIFQKCQQITQTLTDTEDHTTEVLQTISTSERSAPHYFRGSSYQSERIEEENMTPQQIKNYHLGYGNADIKVVAEANTVFIVDGWAKVTNIMQKYIVEIFNRHFVKVAHYGPVPYKRAHKEAALLKLDGFQVLITEEDMVTDDAEWV